MKTILLTAIALVACLPAVAQDDLAAFEARRRELRAAYVAADAAGDTAAKAAIADEFRRLDYVAPEPAADEPAAAPADAAGGDPFGEIAPGLVDGDVPLADHGLGTGASTRPGPGSLVPVDPGLGTAARTQAGGSNDAFWKEVVAVLETIPTGRAALAAMRAGRVPVRIGAGPRAAASVDFDARTVSVEVGRGQSPEIAALYFVHEMHHATAFLDGTSPDPRKTGVEWYVEEMTREEAHGTALSIRARMELTALGRKTKVAFPGASSYEWAYKVSVEGGDSPEMAHYQSGRHLFFVFRFLQSIGPNQFETYPTYYRRDWKRSNPGK